MTPPQGGLGIERMCALAGVSRASYYRHWRGVAPGREQIDCGMCCSAWRSGTVTTATGASRRCCGAKAGR